MKSNSDNTSSPASYGFAQDRIAGTELDVCKEALQLTGFTIIENVLSVSEVVKYNERLEQIYQEQEALRGRDFLESINEADVVRCPLLHDECFLELAMHSKILELAYAMLGEYIIIHLQNGVISRADVGHHQSAWHRDLPYQNFVVNHPLAISALVVLEEFSIETGGTQVIPGSHKQSRIPSDKYLGERASSVNCPAGSVLFFDSMLLHRAGKNRSGKTRRAINHMYVTPILKQQIDLPSALAGRHSEDPTVARLLGYESKPAVSVDEWYECRSRRLHKR